IDVPPTLGSITLRPHQRAAAARLLALLRAHGGAMLADPVGVGKTYVALAVARTFGDVLVLAPAALRGMWRDALRTADVSAEVLSHEALSRGTAAASVAGPSTLVIIDECHRLRSPQTRRYAVAARLCQTARVLLLSATPIQNRHGDLAAELALFLGRAAWTRAPEELAAHVVRTASADQYRGMPILEGPHRLVLDTNDGCLDQILALPAPIPAADEGVAAALQVYTLVH